MNGSTSKGQLMKLSTIDACGALVIVGLSVVMFVGVVEPTRVHNRRASAAIAASAKERQRLAGINTLAHALKLQIQEMSTQLQRSPVKIYPPEALNRRLVDIGALAAESGLNVNELKPRTGERSDRFVMVPIRLSGRGSYPSCATFLHALHERAGDFTVSSFQLSGAAEPAASGGEFTFDLRWISSSTPVIAPVNNIAVADIHS